MPYIAVSAGSFSTLMDSISSGEKPERLPFGPGWIATPSTTESGSLPPALPQPPPRRAPARRPGHGDARESAHEHFLDRRPGCGAEVVRRDGGSGGLAGR